MNKKIILSLFVIFMLTGCSVNYELDFDNDKLNESINIDGISNLSDEQKELYDNEVNAVELITGDEESKINIDPLYKKEKNKNNMNLKYSYDYDLFYSSRILTNCFDEQVYMRDDNTVVIDVNSINDECYTGPMTIKFKTDKLVDRNNADKVKGNEYTWNIKSQDDFKIEFSVILDQTEKKPTIFTYIFKIILVGVLITLLIFLIKLYKKLSLKEEGDK